MLGLVLGICSPLMKVIANRLQRQPTKAYSQHSSGYKQHSLTLDQAEVLMLECGLMGSPRERARMVPLFEL